MIIGGVVCQLYAPETGKVHLDSVGEDTKASPVPAMA
jgi:hypothetical protein